MDLAGHEVERDLVARDHRAEALGEALKLQDRLRHDGAPRQNADDAAAREQHQADQERAQQQQPVLAHVPKRVLQHNVECGARAGPNRRRVPPRITNTMISPEVCQESIEGLTKRLRSA